MLVVTDLCMIRKKSNNIRKTPSIFRQFGWMYKAFNLGWQYNYLIIVEIPDVVIILSNHFFVLVALIDYLLEEKLI